MSTDEVELLRQRVAELEASLARADAERQKAAAVLARRDEQWSDYLRLFHAVPVGIAYIDGERVFQLCNQTAANFLGCGVEQIVGSHLHDAVPSNPMA